MKTGSLKHHAFILVSLAICFLQLTLLNAQAQYSPYYNSSFPAPYFYTTYFFSSFSSSFPFAQTYNSQLLTYARSVHTPLSTTSLFPAPTLPAVPAVTAGGVGVSTLIPTIPITVSVPANSLAVNPLAGLIAYTPLSLIGLTYAPVPVLSAPVL